MLDLVIANGKIITKKDIYRADIGIYNEKIEVISRSLREARSKEKVDAENCYILPGAVDAHTNLEMPYGNTFSADDFESGTRAAACGGTTTIIDLCHTIQRIWSH